jgi:hypothetical protein
LPPLFPTILGGAQTALTLSAEGPERRRSPRVDLLSEFRGHLMTLDEVVSVQQLGPGGMTLAAAVPLSPAHTHDLRLTFDDRVVTLRARVVHTRATIVRDDVVYVSGVSFVEPSPEAVAAIEQFLGLPEGSDDKPSDPRP